MDAHSPPDNGRPLAVIDLLTDECAVDVLFIKIIGDSDFEVSADPPEAEDRDANDPSELESGDMQRAVFLE
jgi:hypothetical protein